MTYSLGAYYQVYNNKKATDFVLSNFLTWFPTAKVLLISDGGEDFSDLATKYNCGYIYLHNIFGNKENGYPQLPYNKERMLEAWRRHKLACDHNQSDYTIILEDDVFVQKGFDITKEFSLRGVRIGNNFTPEIKKLVELRGGKPSNIYGMCGGSIYNAKTFNNIYNDVVNDTESNHESWINNNGTWLLGAIDANITFHFNARGYPYEVSPWLAEIRDHVNCWDYPIIHQYKVHYNK